MAELKGSILDFLEENPDSTLDDVVAHFGSAETVGYSYILEMDEKERQKLLSHALWVKRCIIVAVIACLLLALGGKTWITYDNSKPLVCYQGK